MGWEHRLPNACKGSDQHPRFGMGKPPQRFSGPSHFLRPTWLRIGTKPVPFCGSNIQTVGSIGPCPMDGNSARAIHLCWSFPRMFCCALGFHPFGPLSRRGAFLALNWPFRGLLGPTRRQRCNCSLPTPSLVTTGGPSMDCSTIGMQTEPSLLFRTAVTAWSRFLPIMRSFALIAAKASVSAPIMPLASISSSWRII